MSIASRAALVVASAVLGLATVGCADLTRPDEIVIIAEPPPAPKAPAPTGQELAEAQGASEDAAPARARPRPAPKAGGG